LLGLVKPSKLRFGHSMLNTSPVFGHPLKRIGGHCTVPN
jgi:hypothetical protein